MKIEITAVVEEDATLERNERSVGRQLSLPVLPFGGLCHLGPTECPPVDTDVHQVSGFAPANIKIVMF